MSAISRKNLWTYGSMLPKGLTAAEDRVVGLSKEPTRNFAVLDPTLQIPSGGNHN